MATAHEFREAASALRMAKLHVASTRITIGILRDDSGVDAGPLVELVDTALQTCFQNASSIESQLYTVAVDFDAKAARCETYTDMIATYRDWQDASRSLPEGVFPEYPPPHPGPREWWVTEG